jgi:hypothetical protein
LNTSGYLTRQQTGIAAAAVIIWSLIMLWLCWSYGIRHDYIAYIDQWKLVLDGANPWLADNPDRMNTYGPLYNVIGFLLPWSDLAPKFLMVAAMLMANAALVFELIRKRGAHPIQAVYLLSVPTNVLVIGAGITYGLNDSFVAALLIFAVLSRYRGHLVAAGVLVGLAALTKYYPLLLLPFFALDERRLTWSVIVGGLGIFCVGFVAALAIWGHGPIDAMLYGSNRPPKLLSIIAALKSLFGDASVVRWLIRYNTYFVVSGVAAAFLFAWKQGLNWLEGAVFGYLVMLTAYKVGNQQFYLPWLFLVAALPLLNRSSADRMATVLLPAVLLLSLYHFGYEFYSDTYTHEFHWVRSYGGFIAFAVSAVTITLCAINLRSRAASSHVRPQSYGNRQLGEVSRDRTVMTT